MSIANDNGSVITLNPRERSAWSCTFTDMYGEEVDMKQHGYIDQISIYESIYNDCMFGKVLLKDMDGFAENHNLIGAGEETIHIKILTTGDAKEIDSNLEKTFRVNSYDNVQRSSDKTGMTYSQMGIVSPYLIENNRTRINRSFNSMAASEIVDYIAYDVLKLGQSFDIDWDDLQTNETTKNIKNVVIPGWSPFKTINWLCENSFSAEGNSSNYLFFENNDGFHFTTLDKLKKQEKSIRSFVVSANEATLSSGNKNESIVVTTNIATNFSNFKRYNHTSSMMNGLYGGKVYTHNIITKEYNSYEIEYDSDEVEMGMAELNGAGQFKSVPQCNLGFMPDEYLYRVHDMTPKNHYALRDMKMAEMRTNLVKFDIAGDSNVWAGDIIDLTVPTNNILFNESGSDPFLSGHWLVTAIHHKLSNTNYVMTIECMKDSYENTPEPT